MSKTVNDILRMIEEKNVKMIDFKKVDINGQYRRPLPRYPRNIIRAAV